MIEGMEVTELSPEETRQRVSTLIEEMGFNKAAHAIKIMQIGVADNLNQEAAQKEIEKRKRARQRWWSFKSTSKQWLALIFIGLAIWFITQRAIPWLENTLK